MHPRGIPWTSHFWSVWGDFRTNIAQIALSFVFLPHQAWLMCDAIIRALYRQLISRRNCSNGSQQQKQNKGAKRPRVVRSLHVACSGADASRTRLTLTQAVGLPVMGRSPDLANLAVDCLLGQQTATCRTKTVERGRHVVRALIARARGASLKLSSARKTTGCRPITSRKIRRPSSRIALHKHRFVAARHVSTRSRLRRRTRIRRTRRTDVYNDGQVGPPARSLLQLVRH